MKLVTLDAETFERYFESIGVQTRITTHDFGKTRSGCWWFRFGDTLYLSIDK